jgi:hypothetical protein
MYIYYIYIYATKDGHILCCFFLIISIYHIHTVAFFPKKIMLSFKVNRRIESSNTIIGPRPEKLVKVEQTMGYRGKYGKNSNCLWVLTEA